MFLSCSDFCSSCSEALDSCLDLLHSYSNMVANCSDRTPFWYSRSHALDSARSRSRWALWMFLSIRFIACLSLSFSSVRGSILFYQLAPLLGSLSYPLQNTKIMKKNSGLQHQRGAFQMQY